MSQKHYDYIIVDRTCFDQWAFLRKEKLENIKTVCEDVYDIVFLAIKPIETASLSFYKIDEEADIGIDIAKDVFTKCKNVTVIDNFVGKYESVICKILDI